MNLSKKLVASFVLFVFGFFFAAIDKIYAIDLTEYIARPNFVEHDLSTGEHIKFTAGPGANEVRMYKNSNYEQFILKGDGIYRREDTSWAPKPGFGDAHCQNSNKAAYSYDPGCTKYQEGQAASMAGTKWSPNSASVGQSWSTPTYQVLTIDSNTSGGLKYCSLTDFAGYEYPKACNVLQQLVLDNLYPSGSFTFCTGIKNVADVIKITTTGGVGAGDTFYFMKGYGLVQFEAPGFQGGLMGPGANSSGCNGTAPTTPPGPSNVTISEDPIPQPYVGGIDTEDNEFHALRPYQASPYGMLERYVEQDTLYCGNDIIVKQTAEMEPNGICVPEGINLRCSGYIVSGSARVEVDLRESDLPIINNTTLVPNRINSVNLLDDKARVNNYVNWFLGGSAHGAYDNPVTKTAKQIDRIINFSGPLNKLFPADLLDFNRGRTISITQYRHNQIYECLVLGNPVSCVGILAGVDKDARLQPEGQDGVGSGDPLSKSPYVPLSPTEDRTGEVVLPEPQALNDTTKPTQPESPDNITVDQSTLVFEPDPGIVDLGILNSVGINQVNPSVINGAVTPARNDLYFSGVEEASNLAELLQKTYVPIDLPTFSEDTGQDAPYFNTTSFTKRCELADAKNNPGDDLFGDFHSDQKGYNTNIKGTVSYTTLPFDVVFKPKEALEPSCVAGCNGDPFCLSQCTTVTVYGPQPVVIYAAMSVYTKSPKLNEIAERLVGGATAAAKRFFPYFYLGEIKKHDYAAYTDADYKLAADNTSPNVEVLAGDPKNNRSGKDARIYFPHLGAVSEYFLKGIQCVLRPKGMCDSAPLAQPGSTRKPGYNSNGLCEAPKPDSVEFETMLNAAIARGESASRVPKALLKAIYIIEGFTAYMDPEKYNCKRNTKDALGLMQIVFTGSFYKAALPPQQQPTVKEQEFNCNPIPDKLNLCYPPDAIELAARILLEKADYDYPHDKFTGNFWDSKNYEPTNDLLLKNDIFKAAWAYYGTNCPDSKTQEFARNREFTDQTQCRPDGTGKSNCNEMGYGDLVCHFMGMCPTYPLNTGWKCGIP